MRGACARTRTRAAPRRRFARKLILRETAGYEGAPPEEPGSADRAHTAQGVARTPRSPPRYRRTSTRLAASLSTTTLTRRGHHVGPLRDARYYVRGRRLVRVVDTGVKGRPNNGKGHALDTRRGENHALEGRHAKRRVAPAALRPHTSVPPRIS